MTVDSLQVAKDLVEELQPENVEAVFRYTNANKILFAVFTKNQYIDIYQSPYCECIEKIFENGKWMDWEKIFADWIKVK